MKIKTDQKLYKVVQNLIETWHGRGITLADEISE